MKDSFCRFLAGLLPRIVVYYAVERVMYEVGVNEDKSIYTALEKWQEAHGL